MFLVQFIIKAITNEKIKLVIKLCEQKIKSITSALYLINEINRINQINL